jgi:hypothetical protein
VSAVNNVGDSDQWRATRRYLNGNRHGLARVASGLYPGFARIGPTALLCRSGWLPDRPTDLDAITLRWRPDTPRPAVVGTEDVASAVLPFDSSGDRFACYAAALGALDRPGLFENRPSYRLLGAKIEGSDAEMAFGPASYFDGVNIGEAVAHELAATSEPHFTGLPLRSAIGDPTDLGRRPVLPAISVLTLRLEARTGRATFVLHSRDTARVAHGGGLYQVMPVGVFQPSADGKAALLNDFDLWRCIAREYSEEFLGGSEDYGDGALAYDYEAWPFYRSLTKAKDERLLRIHYLGMGVDPLSLATDILTVSVIDADVFDEIFAGLVRTNAEGTIVGAEGTRGFEFDDATVRRLIDDEPMQAAGAAVLTLSWQHRSEILAA